MALQYSTAVRNAKLDAIETTIGTAPLLKIYTGSVPANCAAAATGTVLVTMTLPSDWMANAASGSKSLSGTWEDTSADASGTAGYFRIYDSGGTTCHLQGTVGQGSGDLSLDNTNIATGQDVKINTFTLSDNNG